MSPAMKWVGGVVGLLVANLIAMGILIAAAHDGSSHVIPDYYERAVRHDEALDQATRNRLLGWQPEAALSPGTLTMTVRDRDGAPLTGAAVRVTGFARARAGETFDLALEEVRPGTYVAQRPTGSGWHDLAVAIVHGSARYEQRFGVEAP
jgi:nitrogen fixation protein FixH